MKVADPSTHDGEASMAVDAPDLIDPDLI